MQRAWGAADLTTAPEGCKKVFLLANKKITLSELFLGSVKNISLTEIISD
jgi:hypothetical protein